MKRSYLIILLLLCGFSINAQDHLKTITLKTVNKKPSKNIPQKSVIWLNDFSDANDWAVVTTGGISANWVIGTSAPAGQFEIGAIESTTAANGYALFDADYYCVTSANSYIRTVSPINLSSSGPVTLTFESYAKIHTLSELYVGFSTDSVTFTWKRVHANLDINESTHNPKLVYVSTDIIGNSPTAYIAFKYIGGCDYAWMVDDVLIIATPQYDLAVADSWIHHEGWGYSMIPQSQTSPVTMEAFFKNLGTNDLQNITFTATIEGQLDTTMSTVLSQLAPFADGEVLSLNFVPVELGDYSISMELTSLEQDDNLANNDSLVTYSFSLTPETYAVDREPYIYIPALEEVYLTISRPYNEMGNGFTIYQTANLYGMEFAVSDDSKIGSQVKGVLYKYNENSNSLSNLWIQVMETPPLTLSDTSYFNSILTYGFPTPYQVEAGASYIMAVRALTDSVFLVGNMDERYTNHYAVIDIGTVESPNIVQMNTFFAPVIRMRFDQELTTNSFTTESDVVLYPNPTSGMIYIVNESGIERMYTVRDIQGKSIMNVQSSSTVDVDLSPFGSGIYFVSIESQGEKMVKKVIVH